jgi:hypothetical protein
MSVGDRLLLVRREEIDHTNVEDSSQLHDCRERGATLAAQNLRQVPLGEIGFQVKAVERAVLLDDDLAQPSAE